MKGSVAITNKLKSMQQKVAMAITGALSSTAGDSVAMVATDVFQINWFSVRHKISKIAKIFGKIEDPENRDVI